MTAADADPVPAHRSSTRRTGCLVAVKPGSLLGARVGGGCEVLGSGLSGFLGSSIDVISGLSVLSGFSVLGVGVSVLGVGLAPGFTGPGPCRFPAPGGGSSRHGDPADGT